MALFIARKIGQAIKIGDDIEVRILSFSRGQIKLSIDAPESVKVYREELYDKIKQEKIHGNS